MIIYTLANDNLYVYKPIIIYTLTNNNLYLSQ